MFRQRLDTYLGRGWTHNLAEVAYIFNGGWIHIKAEAGYIFRQRLDTSQM